jgi:hypothetical protein
LRSEGCKVLGSGLCCEQRREVEPGRYYDIIGSNFDINIGMTALRAEFLSRSIYNYVELGYQISCCQL